MRCPTPGKRRELEPPQAKPCFLSKRARWIGAHSKTWRTSQRPRRSRSVLVCGSPLPLFRQILRVSAPPNPDGIPSPSPRLPSWRGYLGSRAVIRHNPNGVASICTPPVAATPLGLINLSVRPPRVALRLPHKNDAACVSLFFRFGNLVALDDFNHVGKAGVAFPEGLESRHAIALAVEVSTQLGNEQDGRAQGELGSARFFWRAIPKLGTRMDQKPRPRATRELRARARSAA